MGIEWRTVSLSHSFSISSFFLGDDDEEDDNAGIKGGCDDEKLIMSAWFDSWWTETSVCVKVSVTWE